MATIPEEVQKRALFEQEFATAVETKNLWRPIATTLVADAKNIYSPYTSVDAAKAYSTSCIVPISDLTVNKDELVLDRIIGNAIRECYEELTYANFDITTNIRGDLYKSVLKKLNSENTADIASDATSGSPLDLSDAKKVRRFLISVAADNADISVGLRNKVDGATVIRAERHGQAFVAAGREAYIQIVDAVQGILSKSTANYGLATGEILDTPYGVAVINLGDAAADPAQVIWGTAGAPTVAYRRDLVEVKMGENVSETTWADSTPDGEINQTDPILRTSWYMYARTKGKAGVFVDVKPLVVEVAQAQLDPTPGS